MCALCMLGMCYLNSVYVLCACTTQWHCSSNSSYWFGLSGLLVGMGSMCIVLVNHYCVLCACCECAVWMLCMCCVRAHHTGAGCSAFKFCFSCNYVLYMLTVLTITGADNQMSIKNIMRYVFLYRFVFTS